MSKQYLRKATLIIGAGSDLLDVSELHFTFKTTAHTLQTPGTLQLRLFNPAPNTIKKILDEGAQIVLSAGYNESFGIIFTGDIIQVRSGRENGTDTYLDISAADGDKIYNESFVNVTLPAGTNATARLNQIATSGQFKINQIPDNLPTEQLPRGRVYFGLARDHLRTTCATVGANWSISNGQIDIVAENAYKAGDVPEINSQTGMIGVPMQTLEGIAVKCLLNPGISQGIKVHLDNSSIQQYQADLSYGANAQNAIIPPLDGQGFYKVLYCTHTGDTRGQEWYTDFVGYAGDHISRPDDVQLRYMTPY